MASIFTRTYPQLLIALHEAASRQPLLYCSCCNERTPAPGRDNFGVDVLMLIPTQHHGDMALCTCAGILWFVSNSHTASGRSCSAKPGTHHHGRQAVTTTLQPANPSRAAIWCSSLQYSGAVLGVVCVSAHARSSIGAERCACATGTSCKPLCKDSGQQQHQRNCLQGPSAHVQSSSRGGGAAGGFSWCWCTRVWRPAVAGPAETHPLLHREGTQPMHRC